LAAAAVEVLVAPVTNVRYFVPAGHFPVVFCGVYFSVATVVPWPPIQVIFDVRLPVSWLAGTVTDDDPPLANAVGVHVRKLDAVVPFLPEIVVVETNFEHTTLGFTAAEAGTANGTAVRALAASARASRRTGVERCIGSPSDRWSGQKPTRLIIVFARDDMSALFGGPTFYARGFGRS
jgi:hypothetical protein